MGCVEHLGWIDDDKIIIARLAATRIAASPGHNGSGRRLKAEGDRRLFLSGTAIGHLILIGSIRM